MDDTLMVDGNTDELVRDAFIHLSRHRDVSMYLDAIRANPPTLTWTFIKMVEEATSWFLAMESTRLEDLKALCDLLVECTVLTEEYSPTVYRDELRPLDIATTQAHGVVNHLLESLVYLQVIRDYVMPAPWTDRHMLLRAAMFVVKSTATVDDPSSFWENEMPVVFKILSRFNEVNAQRALGRMSNLTLSAEVEFPPWDMEDPIWTLGVRLMRITNETVRNRIAGVLRAKNLTHEQQQSLFAHMAYGWVFSGSMNDVEFRNLCELAFGDDCWVRLDTPHWQRDATAQQQRRMHTLRQRRDLHLSLRAFPDAPVFEAPVRPTCEYVHDVHLWLEIQPHSDALVVFCKALCLLPTGSIIGPTPAVDARCIRRIHLENALLEVHMEQLVANHYAQTIHALGVASVEVFLSENREFVMMGGAWFWMSHVASAFSRNALGAVDYQLMFQACYRVDLPNVEFIDAPSPHMYAFVFAHDDVYQPEPLTADDLYNTLILSCVPGVHDAWLLPRLRTAVFPDHLDTYTGCWLVLVSRAVYDAVAVHLRGRCNSLFAMMLESYTTRTWGDAPYAHHTRFSRDLFGSGKLELPTNIDGFDIRKTKRVVHDLYDLLKVPAGRTPARRLYDTVTRERTYVYRGPDTTNMSVARGHVGPDGATEPLRAMREELSHFPDALLAEIGAYVFEDTDDAEMTQVTHNFAVSDWLAHNPSARPQHFSARRSPRFA